MLYPRIIPCLLIHNKGLVKTIKFKEGKYIGDPINAVRIFNEKFVDELMVLDIDATVNEKEPDFTLIEKIAKECRMPLCYGGGVKTVEQAQKISSLGVEKIAISSAAVNTPDLITEIAAKIGKQSIIVVLDIKKKLFSKKYEVYINNGTKNTGIDVIDLVKKCEDYGAGEIVINSIDNDGVMKGYDMNIINKIRNVINIPMTVMGGAGTLDDIGMVINQLGIIGVAAGSLFVFKGKYKAVLINYPNQEEKEQLINRYFNADL